MFPIPVRLSNGEIDKPWVDTDPKNVKKDYSLKKEMVKKSIEEIQARPNRPNNKRGKFTKNENQWRRERTRDNDDDDDDDNDKEEKQTTQEEIRRAPNPRSTSLS